MQAIQPQPTSALPNWTPPPINQGDLNVRLSLAMPSDTAKGMFFNGALATIRQVADDFTAERCKSAAREKKFVDFFNYPIEKFLRMSFLAAELLSPKLGGYEQVFRRLGSQAATDFLTSAVGKVFLLLAGDPRRLLSAAAGGFRTAVSYGERVAEFTGPKRCTFTMRRDFMPHPYHEGVLKAAIESVGGKSVTVEGQRRGPLDVDYLISWE